MWEDHDDKVCMLAQSALYMHNMLGCMCHTCTYWARISALSNVCVCMDIHGARSRCIDPSLR